MSVLYLHHKGIFVSLKNPTIGQGTWKLDARYGELIWKPVSVYSFIISDLPERLGKLLWPHDSHRVHCGGHHLSGALTGFYLLIPSSYWQNVNFIFISQKPLALGLLFNPSLLYCEVEKTFFFSLCFSVKHLTHFCPNWMPLCLKLLHSSVLLDSKDLPVVEIVPFFCLLSWPLNCYYS